MAASDPKAKVPTAVAAAVRRQRSFSRRYHGKVYAKWIIVVPPKQVRELGWDEGDNLEGVVRGHALVLRRKEAP